MALNLYTLAILWLTVEEIASCTDIQIWERSKLRTLEAENAQSWERSKLLMLDSKDFFLKFAISI